MLITLGLFARRRGHLNELIVKAKVRKAIPDFVLNY